MHYLPILSTIVTLIFTIAVFDRYHHRGGMHLLLWGIGLALYGLGTLTEAILAFTFNPLAIKLWYLSGAMLTAAWLGQGTVHLLVRKRGVAPILTAVITVISLVALGLILVAPIKNASIGFDISQPVSTQYKDILSRNVGIVVLTILLNIYGTLTLVGGALFSAFLFWRKRILVHRMAGNILIAAGALLPAMAGSFIKIGLVDMLYISEFTGVVMMYAGFVLATTVQRVPVLATNSALFK
jgi:hypothetical protein